MPIGEHAEADRLHAVLLHERGHQRDVDLLARRDPILLEDVARRFDHGAREPVFGAGAHEDLGERVALGDLDDAHLARLEILAGVVEIAAGFRQHRRVRGLLLRVQGALQGRLRGRGLDLAGERRLHLDLLRARHLRAPKEVRHLLVVEFLPILAGQDAAEELDDADGDVLRGPWISPSSSPRAEMGWAFA